MQIREFQKLIEQIYGKKDRKRGIDKTFIWFIEEVGELAKALHRNDRNNLTDEFSDCFAWLVTLANLSEIDLEKAIEKYNNACNKCNENPCSCMENF